MTTTEMLALEDAEILINRIAEGRWGAFTTYKCPACAFDSTSLEITRKHVRGHISWIQEQRVPLGVGLFGADGKLIT